MTTKITVRYVTYEHPTEGLLVRARMRFEGGPEIDQGWRRCLDDDRDPCSADAFLRSWFGGAKLDLFDDGVAPQPDLIVGVTGPLSETDGGIHDDGMDIRWGGACPIQGLGGIDLLDGSRQRYALYYRSRGTGWSVDIAEGGQGEFTYGDQRYIWPDGSWLHADESERNIRKAVAKWREKHKEAHDRRTR